MAWSDLLLLGSGFLLLDSNKMATICQAEGANLQWEYCTSKLSPVCLLYSSAVESGHCYFWKFKSTSVIKVATMKIHTISIMQRKPLTTCNHCFSLSAKTNGTYVKKDTGMSMKDGLHVLRYAKRHLSGWSNVEQSVALAILEWRHQAGSCSVSRKFH